MQQKIRINTDSKEPVYKQVITAIEELIQKGEYKEGDSIPSMTELADELQISRETIKNSFSILRKRGLIETTPGKGYFITSQSTSKLKILLIFDKISYYKHVVYNAFSELIGSTSEISIRLHNQDIEVFENFLEESADRYDYYVLTSHFPLVPEIQKRAIKAIKKIPTRKLILLDHYLKDLRGNFGVVYQDYEKDIYDGLLQGIESLRKYKKFNIISMPGSLYAPYLQKGIREFCAKNEIKYEIYNGLNPEVIQRNEVFLILNGQLDKELIEISEVATSLGYKIGEDIGLISYNESPINKIILNGLTVLSTDFEQMGELAAKMILEKSFKKVKCDFRLIRRSTF